MPGGEDIFAVQKWGSAEPTWIGHSILGLRPSSSGQMLSRHVWCVRRIRNEPAESAPDGGHRQGQGRRCLQGRPASIDAVQVRQMAQGIGATEIAKALKIGRASVYRALEAGQ